MSKTQILGTYIVSFPGLFVFGKYVRLLVLLLVISELTECV